MAGVEAVDQGAVVIARARTQSLALAQAVRVMVRGLVLVRERNCESGKG